MTEAHVKVFSDSLLRDCLPCLLTNLLIPLHSSRRNKHHYIAQSPMESHFLPLVRSRSRHLIAGMLLC